MGERILGLSNVKGFIIDLDGTVYAGQHALAGAVEAIHMLQARRIPFVFLSNRGNYSRAMCQEKLHKMGIEVPQQSIVLSSTVTAKFLQQHYPGEAVWPFGDTGLSEELRSHHIPIAVVPEQAQWLVITLHENLTYRELNQAFRAVRHGASIIATNEDRMFPSDEGDSIDVAGMIGAITQATGASVAHVMGKPSTVMANSALAVLQLPAEQCIVVGDSLGSDIGLGRLHGMSTALVLTGNATKEQALAYEHRPDYICENLKELVDQYIESLQQHT